MEENNEESNCGKPCSPDDPCNECVGYWQKMVDQGFWDVERHRWTDRGWFNKEKTILSHGEAWIRRRLNQSLMRFWYRDIPDIFRTDNYGPVTELELPDTKATDEEFEEWLSLYRITSDYYALIMLEDTKCN